MLKKVIGIHDGHDCSITLLAGGEVTASIQEERFTNRKNEWGFPYNAAEWLKKNYDLKGISAIVLGDGYLNPTLCKIKRETNFSIDDWIDEQRLFWKKVLLEKRGADYFKLFYGKPGFTYDEYYNYDGITFKYNDPVERKKFGARRAEFIAAFFSVDPSKIIIPDHEVSHQHYALYASPFRGERVVIVTCEGRGTYSNATVSVYDGREIKEICVLQENYIGSLYRYMTLILGMKPNEHEYKVMGLAPYAKEKDVEKVLPIFYDILHVDGLEIKWKNRPADLYFTLKERLEGRRFDHIAGALQRFTEELLKEWFISIARHTGIRKFVFSGGVAQNIKAAKVLAETDEVEDIFIAPAAGDTSLSAGAAYFGHLRVGGAENTKEPGPLKTVYLGNSFSDKDCKEAVERLGLARSYSVIEDAENRRIAGLLKDGLVLARFVGRMEFGLRALGNRSILADPRNYNIVAKINEKIKNRDFWMPFTPTVLDKYAPRYIVNPKGLRAPFMTMAFDTTREGRTVLPAAVHPADFTIRPQILARDANPSYYDLIEAFSEITGVGALLNTSFNLHGYPIVGTIERAVETFEKSELDGLILNNILILRR